MSVPGRAPAGVYFADGFRRMCFHISGLRVFRRKTPGMENRDVRLCPSPHELRARLSRVIHRQHHLLTSAATMLEVITDIDDLVIDQR
ncbi:MAG TPA: hypothetical protein PLP66_12400 [Phycisphaerae bacterium]|nr:hypothetical protein [Phycisphaerae bacterium]HPM24700.1 hypothetical protein [Phycisphaerae bacterium]